MKNPNSVLFSGQKFKLNWTINVLMKTRRTGVAAC